MKPSGKGDVWEKGTIQQRGMRRSHVGSGRRVLHKEGDLCQQTEHAVLGSVSQAYVTLESFLKTAAVRDRGERWVCPPDIAQIQVGIPAYCFPAG